jgi:hypothetical protein
MVRNNDDNLTGNKKAILFGVGLDSEEGEKRVTKGKNFLLAGGSKPTHELMQEKAIKFNEELDKRKKRLDDIDSEEFLEIADRIDMGEKP